MPRTLKEIEKSKRTSLDAEHGTLDKALKQILKLGTTILAAINSEAESEEKKSSQEKTEKTEKLH